MSDLEVTNPLVSPIGKPGDTVVVFRATRASLWLRPIWRFTGLFEDLVVKERIEYGNWTRLEARRWRELP